ncbi:MAG: hypothetical protein NTW87_04825 [Planctomycetota bacterium]|nr:hypothetical protein [Planctomycetota bacterium]
MIEELQDSQISEALLAAVEKRVTTTITTITTITSRGHDASAWISSHGRLISADAQGIVVQLTAMDDESRLRAFQPSDRVGVTFKLKRHKYVLNSVIAELRPARQTPDQQHSTALLVIRWPTKMHRLLCRQITYFESWPSRIFRAAFWPGGRKAEPIAIGQDTPVWSGVVINITASGLTMRVYPMVLHFLKAGDLVGLRVVAGPGDVVAYSDARFDHGDDLGDHALVCLQFVGLAETPEGQRLLRVIIGNTEPDHAS